MASFTNPIASYAENTFTPDGLALSLDDLLSRKITLLSGQANVARGAVLGKITIGGVSETHAGNTGNGAMTLVATALANAQVGVYTVLCIAAAANSGTFRVFDPKGDALGDYVVAAAAFANQIQFTIADGAADFIVGDKFLVTVAAGSGKYVVSLAAAVDGSQEPDCIMVELTDATAADAEAMGYFRGRFSSAAVTLGAGQTVAAIREGLRQKGIDLVDVVA